jgi:hypothetical protein
MFKFSTEILNNGLSYNDFLLFTENILAQKEQTTPYNDKFYLSYTDANFKRRKKVLDNILLNKKLYNELTENIQQWTWVILDEPWCGDASFTVPIFRAMEIASLGEITIRIFARDSYPEIMEQYLTNNGKAIPKLICLDKNLKELGTWGPRPTALAELVTSWKPENLDINEKIKRTHRWYIKDNGESVQKEFIENIKTWKKNEQ